MNCEIIGRDLLRRRIDQAIRQNERKIRNALSAIGDVAVEETSLRTPFLEGHLTVSIVKDLGRDSDGELCVAVKVPGNSPAAAYAVARHEDYYEIGPLSAEKQMRTGVEVGRKYMARGVEAGIPKYKLIMKASLK